MIYFYVSFKVTMDKTKRVILKQLTAYVLSLLMLVSVFQYYELKPVYAALPEMKEITAEQYYGRNALKTMNNSTNLVAAYDVIAEGVEQSLDKIDLQKYSLTSEQLKLVFNVYINDYPQHFWRKNGYSYSYSGTRIYSISPTYSFTGSKLTTAKNNFNASVAEVIKGIDMSMSEFERELLVHDRIAEIAFYNEATNAHEAYGALVDGEAVCEGYARAFQYALYKVGIMSTTVTGNAGGPHAWNLVKIDGKYYYADLTWDDQSSKLYHAYFNLPLSEMSKDHTLDEDITLPSCTATDANYFKVVGGWINSYTVDNVAECIKKNIDDGEIYIVNGSDEFWEWFKANSSSISQKLGISGGFGYGYTKMGNEWRIHFNASSRKTISVNSVALNKTELQFENIGDKYSLKATVYPSSADNNTVYYSTSNKSVAIVNKYTGEVTTVGEGSANIIATTQDGGKTAVCKITVESKKAGWISTDNKWYYYENGNPVIQWKKIGTKWYYFDESGVMSTEWKVINGKTYYFSKSGDMIVGWKAIDSKWYYFDKSGVMQIGWQKLSDKWYYFDNSGVMKTGWQKLSNKWYYFDNSGVMLTGWQRISAKWYYFNESGVMLTGWQNINNKWYYFEKNGIMQASKWISGVYYVKADGSMAVSEWIDNGKYYVDENGKWIPNT